MIAAATLGLLLLIVLPARALLHSRRGPSKRSLASRYARTTVEIAVLLSALMLVAFLTGLTAEDLGLAWPPPRAGQIGLVITALIIGGLATAVLLMHGRRSPREQQALAELPRGRRDTGLYLLFALTAGFGWELLYRGFLLWWLTPLIGLAGAVAAASIAYGLAHGWKSLGNGLGAIGSAFLFAIAFAATGSLWWLIALHIGLPLIALLAGWRVRHQGTETLSA